MEYFIQHFTITFFFFHLTFIPLVSVSLACCNRESQTGWGETGKCIPSLFRRLEVWNQCGSGARRSLNSLGRSLTFLFQLLVTPGVPWFMVTKLQSQPPAAYGHFFPLCVSVFTWHSLCVDLCWLKKKKAQPKSWEFYFTWLTIWGLKLRRQCLW